MPKPFRLLVEVEEIALGSVMRRLHATPGVVSFNLHLDDKQKSKPKPNGARASGGQRFAMFYAVLKQHKGSATSEQMREAFVAAGMSPKSVHGAAHTLKKDGMIRSPKSGVYELTAKGKSESKQQPE